MHYGVSTRPIYTSMQCHGKSAESRDEVYAIFVGVNWTNRTAPSVFVRRTRLYRGVVSNRNYGAHNSRDNKNLTKSGRYTQIQTSKHFILVQAMEHDGSSATKVTRTLRAVLTPAVPTIWSAAGGSKTATLAATKRVMKATVLLAKTIPGKYVTSRYLRRVSAAVKAGAYATGPSASDLLSIIRNSYIPKYANGLVKNPDDWVGVGLPQALSLNEPRTLLAFGKSPGGRTGVYSFKFSINKEVASAYPHGE